MEYNVEKFADILDKGFISKEMYETIFDIINSIDNQDFLKELLLYAKLTEINYDILEGNLNSKQYYYVTADLNKKDRDSSKGILSPDKYYIIRQAIALNENISKEIIDILSNDKNLYVLESLVSRKDLTVKNYKTIIKTVIVSNQEFLDNINVSVTYGKGLIINKILKKIIFNKSDEEIKQILGNNINALKDINDTINLNAQAKFDRKINYDRKIESNEKQQEYDLRKKIIEKDINSLTKEDVEKIYFDYVKPNINFELIEAYHYLDILELFLSYYPKKLISNNIEADLNTLIINLKDKNWDILKFCKIIYKFLYQFLKYNIKINYKEVLEKYFKVLSKNDEMSFTAEKAMNVNYQHEFDFTVYVNNTSNLLSNLCSIKNVDKDFIEVILKLFSDKDYIKYSDMFRTPFNSKVLYAILDNETIKMNELDSNLLNYIYGVTSSVTFKDVLKEMRVYGANINLLDRKIAERLDTPTEVLKLKMKTNDPFLHLKLLENPNSDKEIYEYIYNNADEEYIKNKAMYLLNKDDVKKLVLENK